MRRSGLAFCSAGRGRTYLHCMGEGKQGRRLRGGRKKDDGKKKKRV